MSGEVNNPCDSRRRTSRTTEDQFVESLRSTNDLITNVRITKQELFEARWAEVEKLAIDLIRTLAVVAFLIEHVGILDVTQEYTKIDGSSGKQFYFWYTMTCLAATNLLYPSPYFRRLVNTLLGHKAPMILFFLVTMIFSVSISATALALFRYFYMRVIDVYAYSDSWLWRYIVNRHLFLFTFLLSRVVPPGMIFTWFGFSFLWQIVFSLTKNGLLILRTVVIFGVKEVQSDIAPASKFIAANSTLFIFAWLFILFLFTTRDTPLMQYVLMKVRVFCSEYFLSIVACVTAAILGFMWKVWEKLQDKFAERVAAVLYAKHGDNILARLPVQFQTAPREVTPIRIFLVDKGTQDGPGLKAEDFLARPNV